MSAKCCSMVLETCTARNACRHAIPLRFINIHTWRPSMRMRLVRNSEVLTWRALAKDGMDLPLDQATTGPSTVQMGNGETYDFEFVPASAGELHLEVVVGTSGEVLGAMK